VRPFDDDQGRFLPRHALLGDAIRGALLPSERGELHSRIADLLVRLDDGSVAAAIAEHLRGANRREEELLWRVRAGRKADALFAYSESCMHWRRALELVSDAVTAPAFIEGMSLADLYGTAGDAFTAAGEGEAASALSKEALTRIGRDADRRSRADVLRRAADWSEPQRALKLLDQARALYRQLPPSRGQVLTMREIAVISHHEGMPSKEIIRDTAELAESLGVRDVAVQMWAVLAAAPADEGEIDAAIAEMSDLCRELDDADDPLLHAWVAMCHTSLLFDAGRLVDVPAVGAVALDRAAEYGSERSLVTSIVRTNVCKALTELGDIDTAAALIDPVTDETPGLSNRLSHECRADLDMLRGNLDAAASRWAQLHELPVEPLEFALAAWDREAELRLWRSEPETAISGVLGVLSAANEATGQNFSGSPLLLHCGRLFVSALRGCADIADTARGSRDAAKLACAQSAAENLAALLSSWTPDPFVTTFALRTAAAEGASWRAEWARLSGRPDAAAWARAAELWSAQSRPHRAAYGRWRQAQALLARPGDRPAATLALREAIRLCSRHRPLSAEIENLAKWAAIDLRPADDPRGRQRPQHTAAFGLTERELAVLRLLSEGKTNPQIAAALFMSPKTASVHVTHILRKLDVSSRVQAAATAERAGLLQTL
jgi:DNA-binding CsgD family transcriptional regulator